MIIIIMIHKLQRCPRAA